MMNQNMMHTGEMAMGWGWMFLGPLMMIGFLALIVFVVMTLTKNSSSRDNEHGRSQATEILNERFAMGEIDEKQFNQMRHTLS